MAGRREETRTLQAGNDWMELRKIDPRGRLWVVLNGTLGLPGDVVRFPRRRRAAEVGFEAMPSPFDAEIVVDMLGRTVLLPESGKPLRRALKLMKILRAAGLRAQARVVAEAVGPARPHSQTGTQDAA